MDKELLELLQVFLTEARGMLDEIEPQLIMIGLEQPSSPGGGLNSETIHAVFRFFHSMKGSAGSLELKNIAKVTHSAETLLDLFRQGKVQVTPRHVELLLRVVDFIRTLMGYADKNHTDDGFEPEREALLVELNEMIGENKKDKPAASVQPQAPAPVLAAAPADVLNLNALPITPEMVTRFVQEAEELVDVTEHDLLELVKSPEGKTDHIAEAFRAIHSLKGNCGFMGFAELGRLTHRMEEVLDGLKRGAIPSDERNIRALLGIVDALRETISDISKGGRGVVQDPEIRMGLLDSILEGAGIQKKELPPTQPAPQSAPQPTLQPVPAPAPAAPAAAAPAPIAATASPAAATKTPPAPAGKGSAGGPKKAEASGQADIRVNIEKLDLLMNLVGELVIAETMVTRAPALLSVEDEHFERAVHHLRRITSDLQDVAMSVRMVPLSGAFRKLIRLVYDLSNKIGKEVKLELVGEETEVDKTVIEQISDPLVHLVRNSIDHGMETGEERKKAGKSPVGTIAIEARHEGGEVWILIKDDGRGLNREKILTKGLERGLVRGDGSDLSDEAVFRLIFEPGFSTADKITDVSGRGVGMDVVKKNIEKLKGRVELKSTLGQGTTVILRIPLTLAIIEGMLVRVGETRYTIPLLSICESFRVVPERVTVTPDGQELVSVRDQLVPVVRIHELFNKKSDYQKLEEGILVVAEADGLAVGLFADEILGQQETVIKGLSEYFGNVHGLSGCTILGNGEVSLILDIGSIVRLVQSRSAKAGGMVESSPENPAMV